MSELDIRKMGTMTDHILLLATSHGIYAYDRAGDTWRETARGLTDHNVTSVIAREGVILAGTTDGVFRSDNLGKTWELLYDCYCRAVWTDPNDAAHQILGPADGVDSNGRIEETRDGGKTWCAAPSGLNVPWRRHMVERFAQIDDELFAVLSNGALLAAPLASLQWQQILADVKDITAVTSMQA